MSVVLDILGVVLLVLGFWVLLTAFDKQGQERVYRFRISIGSILAGLGNVLFTQLQGLAFIIILIGGLVAITAKRPERT